jgi:hypothetical protein
VTPSTLTLRAEDSSGFVRAAVALNSRATAEMLEMLAADEMMDYDSTLEKNRYLVKEAAARNLNTNSETWHFSPVIKMSMFEPRPHPTLCGPLTS